MLAAGLLHLRRLPGVLRPAIAVSLPAREGPSRAARRRRERRRAGRAPASSSPTWARSSARRSSTCAEPEVRLLSIGEEDEKGNPLTLDAHALLRESSLNFAGNAESRDLLRGAADVVVTDGFTGNIALKLLEGTISELLDALREEITATAVRQARRPADPARRPAPAHAARPGHLRRRLPARPARARRDRARQLEPPRDRERDPARRPRRRAPGRRTARRAASRARRCMIARFYPAPHEHNEVTWQRRVKRSSSASRKS